MNLSKTAYQITEKIYQQFIEISGDKHPLHTNAQFAQDKGFRDKVCHGNILNCFLSHAIGEHLGLTDVMILNQSINYRVPLYVNDEMELEMVVKTQIDFLPGTELKFKFICKDLVVADGSILIKTKL